MSNAGEESRDWHFYVTDMIEFAEKVRTEKTFHRRQTRAKDLFR